MALLELEGILFRAGERQVLSDMSLSVERSQVHALLGSNGAGKSSLAHLIMGCAGYQPQQGEIRFDGERINGLGVYERARRGISLAWQEPARFEGIRVSDYLSLGQPVNDPAVCLRMAGLEPGVYLSRMVDRTLSGGERKRIELASLLSMRIRLAILDEPDSGIDMLSTSDILNVIASFRDNGSAVLLITHREEIALAADRASQLSGGSVIRSGLPAEVAALYKQKLQPD